MPQNSTSNSANPPNQSGSAALKGGAFGASRATTAHNANSSKTLTVKKTRELTGKEVAERVKKSKLTILAEHLASLPWQIATVIEKEANSMLKLYLEIGEKSTPLSRFGTTITKKNGQESLYTPSCIREIKNPCTGSRRIKESDEFKSIVSDYDEA